jgi:hypothetical protein
LNIDRPRIHTLLTLLCLAALLVGCGSSSDGSTATTGSTAKAAKKTSASPAKQEGDPGVTTTQVGEAKPDSPEKTVLEWWLYVQINDPESARELYFEPPALADLAGQFNVIDGKLDGSVEIVETAEQEGGETAFVKVRWTNPDGQTKVVELGLQEDGGEWKLSSIPFVNEMVERLLEAEGE